MCHWLGSCIHSVRWWDRYSMVQHKRISPEFLQIYLRIHTSHQERIGWRRLGRRHIQDHYTCSPTGTSYKLNHSRNRLLGSFENCTHIIMTLRRLLWWMVQDIGTLRLYPRNWTYITIFQWRICTDLSYQCTIFLHYLVSNPLEAGMFYWFTHMVINRCIISHPEDLLWLAC